MSVLITGREIMLHNAWSRGGRCGRAPRDSGDTVLQCSPREGPRDYNQSGVSI